MFTQCRGCGEIFKVSVDELVAAAAMVRCSSCGTVFNALDTLSEYKPQHSQDLILHENDNPPPLLTHEFKKSIVKEKITPSNDKISATQDLFEQDCDESETLNIKPEFVVDDKPEKKSSWFLVLLTLLGLGGLAWQTNAALENGSLQLPEGTLKQKVCEYVNCYSESKTEDLSSFVLVSRSIRQHGGRDNALVITTGIMNNSNETLDFPALQVKMSNLHGDVVAMRRFLPIEYLDEATISKGMISQVLIPVSLELQSPGKNAVTFEVGFAPTYGAE
ncbi:MAG TPA: zinc-ribbon and DUF3426 domain-containing protein [Gammaproteobacteria bacterium]|nr:zinc-ribbon and DUF3426 domain-containing protein [Xanthomonadales bacterium]HPI95650.1 zinc-ribbon and DUF3426 domain-containing protein [Gammaproteobacteria bacterium]HPQ87040.1 zinc-ribbon and DUF3426 domain-containing protein [Gammaproteobacteria bacterium]